MPPQLNLAGNLGFNLGTMRALRSSMLASQILLGSSVPDFAIWTDREPVFGSRDDEDWSDVIEAAVAALDDDCCNVDTH